jgi:hypothetical protein
MVMVIERLLLGEHHRLRRQIFATDRGFMATATNAVYRSPNKRMRAGQGLQLTGVQIVVTAVDAAGMPQADGDATASAASTSTNALRSRMGDLDQATETCIDNAKFHAPLFRAQ